MRVRTPQGQVRLVLLAVAIVAVLAGVVIVRGGAPELRDGSESSEELALLLAPTEVYNPVAAGEELPEGFRQVVPRDAIRPVYEPTFVAADAIDWPATSLVIGLQLHGEAKAYPVQFLNWREMVVDSVAGIPVLVTW